MNLFTLVLSAVSALAAIVAAVFAGLARRDYLRDSRRPYRFDVVTAWGTKRIVFVNRRQMGCVIKSVFVDVLGDGSTLVPDALFLGELKSPPYCVPGGTFVAIRPAYGTYNRIPINVNSRIVIGLESGETATSAAGILLDVHHPRAAREKDGGSDRAAAVAEA